MRIMLILVALIATAVQVAALEQKQPHQVVHNVDYIANVAYATNKHKLDLYLPQGQRQFPVVISVHGGGLTTGDKSTHSQIGHHFASAGIVTVVINYRLSPVVSHPGHIQDVAAAFAWVKQHIREYGGDPTAIFVIGHSAGAYLVALLALDQKYLSVHGLSSRDIRGVVPVSGFFYVDRVAPERPKHVWGTEMKTWLDASPARHVRSDISPIFLIYADGDEEWRRQQNEEMAQALRKAGHKDVTVKQVIGRDHLTIWYRLAEGEDVSRLIIGFISRLSKQNGHAVL